MNLPLDTVAAIDRRTRALERVGDILALMLGTALVAALLWGLGDVLLLVFAAALLAVLLRGGADLLSKKLGGSPLVWLAAIILAIAVTIGAAGWLRGPVLVAEARQIYGQIFEQLRTVWDRYGQADWMQPVVDRVKGFLGEGSQRFAGIAAGVGTTTLGGLGSLVVMLVTAIYFAIDPGLYVEGSLRLLPRSWRRRGGEVMYGIGHTLRWWFLGQLVDMVAIGLLTGLGLYVLGVKLAFTLALIAALFNFVPYVGALAGAVPAVLVAFGQGPQMAGYVALLFVAVQTLEGNVIAPLIQKQTVELAPVLTILSQTVLGSLFGPLGLILATPLTAAGVVAVRKIYVEDVLGDVEPASAAGGMS